MGAEAARLQRIMITGEALAATPMPVEAASMAVAQNAAVSARLQKVRSEIVDLERARDAAAARLRRARAKAKAKAKAAGAVERPPKRRTSAQRRRRALEDGELTGDLRPVGDEAGVNESMWATLRTSEGDEVVAIFKPSAGERPGLRQGIEAGTYHQREALAFEVDSMIPGRNVVPPTQSRRVGNRVGSVQEKIPGAVGPYSAKGRKLMDEIYSSGMAPSDYADAQRMHILDAILGNTDRHGKNLLVYRRRGELRVVAIDNGLTMPELVGNNRHRTPWMNEAADSAMNTITEDLHKQIMAVDPERLARLMHARGMSTWTATRAALVRLRALQADRAIMASPKMLEKARKVLGPYTGVDTTQTAFMRLSIESPRHLVSEATMIEIDQLLDRVTSSLPPQ